jgi:hypothetical protein
MSGDSHGASPSKSGGAGGAGFGLIAFVIVLFLFFSFGVDNATKIAKHAGNQTTNWMTGESTGKPAVAADGLSIQYGGTINITKAGIQPFYASGEVKLINSVDYSRLEIAPGCKFIVTTSEDGRHNTIASKSGQPELVIIKVVHTPKPKSKPC